MHEVSMESTSGTLRGNLLIEKLCADQQHVQWTAVTLHFLMTAMLQETEDAMCHVEQTLISQKQWQQLLVIETQKSALTKFASLSSEEMQKLDVMIILQIISSLKRQITTFLSEASKERIHHVLHRCGSCTTDADDVVEQARHLVKKCLKEVEELLIGEEEVMIAGRQWADLPALDSRKQALLELTLEAFESKVAQEKQNVVTCLRAFCEQMIALVPNHSVTIWKDISSFDGQK